LWSLSIKVLVPDMLMKTGAMSPFGPNLQTNVLSSVAIGEKADVTRPSRFGSDRPTTDVALLAYLPTRSAASYQTRSDERHRPPPPHAVFLGSCRGDMPRSSEMRSFYVAAIMPIGGPHSLNFIPILSHTARAPRARMFMGGHHARNVQVCTCSSGRHHAWW
jgi:hypothetical protein